MKKLLAKLFTAPVLMAMAAGTPAPNFRAKNQDGKDIHLTDFKGKFVLIYFYPKDDTPGCTREACDFRDRFADIRKLNTVVLGVSRQDAASHKAFIAKHKLPFDLLVDADGKIGEQFGVGAIPVVGSAFGLSKRQSVLIGPDQKVVKFYDSVDPIKHVDEVIKDIEAAGTKSSLDLK
jgi:peroxiredoxin Q/BCP